GVAASEASGGPRGARRRRGGVHRALEDPSLRGGAALLGRATPSAPAPPVDARGCRDSGGRPHFSTGAGRAAAASAPGPEAAGLAPEGAERAARRPARRSATS